MRFGQVIRHGASLAIAPGALAYDYGASSPSGGAAMFDVVGDAAVVDIRGPLLQHAMAYSWCDSYEAIGARVAAALASPCKAVVMRIDSPGGEVAGCFELARELRAQAAAAGKPLIAYVDGSACSAAYALACAASRILTPPTGLVGSIGCITVAVDQSVMNERMGVAFSVIASGARKADGNPFVPMSDDALTAMQGQVDAMAAVFFDLVAEARGMTAKDVAALDAGIFVGAQAVKVGIADAVVATFGDVLAQLASGDVTAHVGAEAGMDEEEKAKAALKAIAEGDDKEKAAKAKKALAAFEESDEKKDDEKKAESCDPPSKDEKKDDEKATALAALAQVQALTAQLAARDEAEERKTLMASRPDLLPEVVAFLEKQPIAAVRDAVKTFPKGPARGAVQSARAAIETPAATRGDTQGERPASPESVNLDELMGLAPKASAIRHEGTRLFLGVMTPAQARAESERREAEARAAAQKGGSK